MSEEVTEPTVKSLQAELAELRADKVRLMAESAKYRTGRNASLREAYALKQIAKAHGVDTDDLLTVEALDSLTIENGEVSGTFDYERPSLQSQVTQKPVDKPAPTTPVALSEEMIAAMSSKEINDRWDEVSAFMASTA